MTQLLEKAFLEAQRLTDDEQDALAARLLADIQDEKAWEARFASTQDQLERWADKVREDIAAGRVTQCDQQPS